MSVRVLARLGLMGLLWVPGLVGCSALQNSSILSASIEYWDSELGGDVQFGVSGSPGDELDLEDTLGIDVDEGITVFHGTIAFGSALLDVKYFDATFEGDAIVAQPFEFNGRTFDVSSRVLTDVDLVLASAYLKTGFPIFPHVVLGPLIGVSYIDLDAQLNSTTPVLLSVSDQIELPVPVFGLAGAVDVPLGDSVSIFAEGEIAALFADYDAIDGKFIDYSVAAGLSFFQLVRIGGGFRSFEVDFDDSSGKNEAEIDLGGPFLFGEISF